MDNIILLFQSRHEGELEHYDSVLVKRKLWEFGQIIAEHMVEDGVANL